MAARKQAYALKNDRYRKVRGGDSTFLSLFCSNCDSWLMVYQKDGTGGLLRCYLNRIFAPRKLEVLQHNPEIITPKDVPPLACENCKTIIGFPIQYRDGRLAFRLVRGSCRKKKGVEEGI